MSPPSPPGPSASSGSAFSSQHQSSGVKVRYSREEILALNSDFPAPVFPAHVNPGLITASAQVPSIHVHFEHDPLMADWAREQEKRSSSSRGGAGGGGLGDRRQGGISQGLQRGGSGRGQDQAGGGRGPGGYPTGGSSWRSGGGASGDRGKEPSRWGGASGQGDRGGGSRWGGYDNNQGGPGLGGQQRGGQSRWDGLRSGGAGAGRNDTRNSRLQQSSSSHGQSGDPTRDAQDAARWRRPGSHGDDMPFDDRGTFGDASMTTGGLGLDAMAAAAEKFAQEMEASRNKVAAPALCTHRPSLLPIE